MEAQPKCLSATSYITLSSPTLLAALPPPPIFSFLRWFAAMPGVGRDAMRDSSNQCHASFHPPPNLSGGRIQGEGVHHKVLSHLDKQKGEALTVGGARLISSSLHPNGKGRGERECVCV